MAEKVTWDDLNLPEFESEDDLDRRLLELQKEGGRTHLMVNTIGYKPTKVHAKIVAAFSALGVNGTDIAEIMSIPYDVLKRYYDRELKASTALANVAVAQVALDMATSGQSPDMTKFWLKTRAGWRESPKALEISGPNGKAIEIDSARAKLANILDIDAETGEVDG